MKLFILTMMAFALIPIFADDSFATSEIASNSTSGLGSYKPDRGGMSEEEKRYMSPSYTVPIIRYDQPTQEGSPGRNRNNSAPNSYDNRTTNPYQNPRDLHSNGNPSYMEPGSSDNYSTSSAGSYKPDRERVSEEDITPYTHVPITKEDQPNKVGSPGTNTFNSPSNSSVNPTSKVYQNQGDLRYSSLNPPYAESAPTSIDGNPTKTNFTHPDSKNDGGGGSGQSGGDSDSSPGNFHNSSSPMSHAAGLSSSTS